MRIGLIANTFDPVFGEKAGGHVHFFEVAKRWPSDDIWVFGPAAARETVLRELPDATFVKMPSFDRLGDYQVRYLVRTLGSLLRLPQLRSCDVLLATSHFVPDVVPASLANGRRFAVTIHHIVARAHANSQHPLRTSIGAFSQSFSFAIIRRFARAVFVSELETARRVGIDPMRTATHLITHGVQQRDADGREALRSGGVFLGRLVASKGVDDLLRAWRIVCDELPDATLTIVGSGLEAYVRYLVDLATELGLAERVVFAGLVDEELKQRALASAAVFAFASKEEGFGIAVAEAMSNGLPCVLYDLSAYRDAFTRGRLLADVGDVATFARLVITILKDEDLRSRLSIEARELSKKFSWEAAATIEHRALQDVSS